MDPDVSRAVVRVALFCAFAAAWCAVVHVATARPVTPAPLLMAAGGAAAALALVRRERPFARTVNLWDEAATFVFLAALARVLWDTP